MIITNGCERKDQLLRAVATKRNLLDWLQVQLKANINFIDFI